MSQLAHIMVVIPSLYRLYDALKLFSKETTPGGTNYYYSTDTLVSALLHRPAAQAFISFFAVVASYFSYKTLNAEKVLPISFVEDEESLQPKENPIDLKE